MAAVQQHGGLLRHPKRGKGERKRHVGALGHAAIRAASYLRAGIARRSPEEAGQARQGHSPEQQRHLELHAALLVVIFSENKPLSS